MRQYNTIDTNSAMNISMSMASIASGKYGGSSLEQKMTRSQVNIENKMK